MIGDYIIEYKKGGILFVGRNVPHCSSMYGYIPETELAKSEILQFHPDLLPVRIHNLPEYIHISNILLRSQNGLVFRSRALGKSISLLIDQMKMADRIEKINNLFSILEILGKSKYGVLISENQFDAKNAFCEVHQPLQRVYDYLYLNLKREISLEEISQHVNINPTSLCRLFKKKTRMTLFEFLNKIRIENACKLLLYTDLNISEIAYQSGFNNMAYFNRRFKLSTQISPSDYRNQRTTI